MIRLHTEHKNLAITAKNALCRVKKALSQVFNNLLFCGLSQRRRLLSGIRKSSPCWNKVERVDRCPPRLVSRCCNSTVDMVITVNDREVWSSRFDHCYLRPFSRLNSSFSLQYWYASHNIGDENKENHQLGILPWCDVKFSKHINKKFIENNKENF